MKEVITTSIVLGFDQKKTLFFEEGSWFKLNNLVLVLRVTLTFYTNVEKELKIKSENFGS